MAEVLEFDSVHEYSLFKVGISVDATLENGNYSVDIDAKIDTGSTYCVFERHYGERLDLNIESGMHYHLIEICGTAICL